MAYRKALQLDLPVEEFTTPDPITASVDTSVEELKKLMQQNNVRHIPIVQEGKVVGVVSDRDLRVIEGLEVGHKALIHASDIMAQDPVAVSSVETLDEVAFVMAQKKIGSVIVNEGDKLLGIFTVTDALNALIEVIRTVREE